MAGLKEDDPLRPYPKLSVTKPMNLKNRVASDIGRLLGIEKSFVSSPLALARGIQQEVRKGERKVCVCSNRGWNVKVVIILDW